MIAFALPMQNEAEQPTKSKANQHATSSHSLAPQAGGAAHAFQELKSSLELLVRAADGGHIQIGEKDCTITYRWINCKISFWHVLDIRFNQYAEEKGRADMVLTWSARDGVWHNRRRTLIMRSDDLAVHCLDRVLLMCRTRLAQD